jgi:hypothetical protein
LIFYVNSTELGRLWTKVSSCWYLFHKIYRWRFNEIQNAMLIFAVVCWIQSFFKKLQHYLIGIFFSFNKTYIRAQSEKEVLSYSYRNKLTVKWPTLYIGLQLNSTSFETHFPLELYELAKVGTEIQWPICFHLIPDAVLNDYRTNPSNEVS